MTNRKNTLNKIKTKIVEFFKNTYCIKINEQRVYVIDVMICYIQSFELAKYQRNPIRKPVFFKNISADF